MENPGLESEKVAKTSPAIASFFPFSLIWPRTSSGSRHAENKIGLHAYCTIIKSNLLVTPFLRWPQKEVKKLKTLQYSNPAPPQIIKTADMSTWSPEDNHVSFNSLPVVLYEPQTKRLFWYFRAGLRENNRIGYSSHQLLKKTFFLFFLKKH